MTGAERHYTGEQGKWYHEKKRHLPPVSVPWVARLRAAKIQPFVSDTDTVFEYGAGSGWNLIALRCNRRIAFDISESVSAPDKSIEWVRDINAVPQASANVLICHHTLEHLMNPAETLEWMRRILRARGKLLLFVPFEKESRYRCFNPAEPNHHLYSWNVQTLGNLVSECGFRVDSAGIGRFGYDRFAAAWACKFGIGESGFRLVRLLAHTIKPASEVRIVATPV
ncbi:MAG: class I SAM-dependent methyltransferase [Limisphaerales bacterium]